MLTDKIVTTETEKVHLRKKDLLKSFAIWELTSEMCLNYERLMALGFCHAMTPILKRLYPNKEDLAAGLTRHMAFFNTENQWGAIIPGITASLEEQKANGAEISDEMINDVKTGLMGPIAGIGDTITQGLVKTILLAIGLGMATKGSVLGPIFFFLTYTTYILGTGYFTYFQGYKFGKSAFAKITNPALLRRITDCMSILGLMVAGSLVASTLYISTPFKLTVGDTVIKFQELFDQIMPGLLGVLATGVVYYCLKKNISIIKIMIIMTVIGIASAFLGIL
ncbi:MAG: PTS system mannose/fructose/sorbose family transporter subunit IID [Bacilli bacterium]